MITVMAFSKYVNSNFAQRKPNGNLRLLVNLSKISCLIADDCTNNNHPDSTFSDATQELGVNSIFCKRDCFQDFHCLQITDQQSVKMLAFNFASRTFLYKRRAQGVSRSLSAFPSFMREHLIPVVRANQGAQYLHVNGIAANNAMDLTLNLRAVWKCILPERLKLTKKVPSWSHTS